MFHPIEHISPKDLPENFTNPFHYSPHPLCIKAAKELQNKLCEWHWDSIHQGKMYGVLLVKNTDNAYGFLWAYSGNPSQALDKKAFVPPIFDYQNEASFFHQGEMALKDLNERIKRLEESSSRQEALERLRKLKEESERAIAEHKQKNQAAKAQRRKLRNNARNSVSKEDWEALCKGLQRESQHQKAELKREQKMWQTKLADAREDLAILDQEIAELKQCRQKKSAALQQQLFDQYQLLNAQGERKALRQIFYEYRKENPPAAAGDCAAPRLLQYAYENGLKPLAMAEFWWGKSPLTSIRKQGHFYPSCKSKCEPILHHMLKGLKLEKTPDFQPTKALKVVYEDEALLVINKPEGLLSVPGKSKQKSVSDCLQEMRPDLKELYIVHRLDMATSGLMLIAKKKNYYILLQKQFTNGQVKKAYEALLDGKIKMSRGQINLPLRVDLDNRPQQMVCHQYGKPSLTHWKRIRYEKGKTRVAFFPYTGRTHQLRVHAAHPLGLNTAIVGDQLYGKKAQRLMLHAASLEFTHPISGERMRLCAEVEF